LKLKKYDIVYFIGIGGIGMSALARWFKVNGYKVFGYDLVSRPFTDQLASEGISIHFEDDIHLIPEEVKNNPETTLVVYTPAVPSSNQELQFFKENGYNCHKRSEVLGCITKNKFTIAVAGTHGKTTTSSILTHILKTAGWNISAFIGGLTGNYSTNFIYEKNNRKEQYILVEADEFDRSFLTLHPDIAIVTSADADHLDIYGDKGELQKGFGDFIKNIKPGGLLVLNDVLGEFKEHNEKITIETYGINRGQFFANNISMKDGFFYFDLYADNTLIKELKLGIPGFYNVENAVAAITVALSLEIPPSVIRLALGSFKGVKRRFEYIIDKPELIYIDDYAHHPEEIRAFISSLRKMYPERNIAVVFQPHLYSRTRDFAIEFGKSLSLADEVYLLDIYPAREKPIPGVTSDLIFQHITCNHKMKCSINELTQILQKRKHEVIATVGAGDIENVVEELKNCLVKKA